jgi:uncharacterized protein
VSARYEVRKASDGSFYYVLLAANSEVLSTSETYETHSDAERAVESAKRAAGEAAGPSGLPPAA